MSKLIGPMTLEWMYCGKCGKKLQRVFLEGQSTVEVICRWCKAKNTQDVSHLTTVQKCDSIVVGTLTTK